MSIFASTYLIGGAPEDDALAVRLLLWAEAATVEPTEVQA